MRVVSMELCPSTSANFATSRQTRQKVRANRCRRLWGNTFPDSTPAFSQMAFISAQICLRDKGRPLLVRNNSPEAILFFLAYFRSFRHSFPGMRMVRILPFREIYALPISAASTVI